ncbi:MAG: IucA/IucC family siderophore biosynthesis protein, partial [Ketobacter sp.]
MTNDECWQHLNRQLVAKNISELQYEQCFSPKGLDDCWSLVLNSGVTYSFYAWESIWGQLRVNADSLLRDGMPVTNAAQFYIDAQAELALTDIVLANLLEECAQTLQGDMQAWLLRQEVNAGQIADMDVDLMQPYLDGHPKAVLNKGRLGWGSDELAAYAPESNQPLQLRWIAVSESRCTIGCSRRQELDAVVRSAMTEEHYARLVAQVKQISTRQYNQHAWILLPVHPWQWQHKIKIHFQEWMASGELLDLGLAGDRYLPLQSIRTLANVDRPQNPNVKLPLTILNTSSYRGIPSKYIEVGARLSDWLDDCCQTDPLLYDLGTMVLREPVGISCAHPRYTQIEDAPYRYHEMLGVIWRDSVQSKLEANEQAMLMAALLQQDNTGDAVVQHLIIRSGWSPLRWIRKLFDVVVIPLYHLMCQYGVGLVAHGQNLTLILEAGVPKRLAIKDLQ